MQHKKYNKIKEIHIKINHNKLMINKKRKIRKVRVKLIKNNKNKRKKMTKRS